MFSRIKYSEYPAEIRKKMIEQDKEKKRKSADGHKKKSRVALVVLIVLVLLLISVFGFGISVWLKGRRAVTQNVPVNIDTGVVGLETGNVPVLHNSGKTIEYNGKTYIFNDNIVTFALIGVDKEILGLDNAVVGTAGQADTIALALYDTVSGKASVLAIPRDTIADVNTYDVDGNYLSISKQQICVSYAYGNGGDTSCENTLTSISRLIFGIPINYYIALDLDGIPVLNDSVGGVKVTCLETIGQFTEGETIVLHGEEADRYVRKRDTEKIDADAYRRVRQKQYMEQFISQAIAVIKKDFSFVPKFYNLASNYSVTNITADMATYIGTNLIGKNFGIQDFKTVPGEYRKGEKYSEYIVDSDGLFEMVLELFYTQA